MTDKLEQRHGPRMSRTWFRLLTCALILCCTTGVPVPAAAVPLEPGERTAKAQFVLGLTKVGPAAATEAGKNSIVRVAGEVLNQTAQALNGHSVRLRWRATPLASRSELAQYAGQRPPVLPGIGAPVPLGGQLSAAGGRQNWALNITTRQMGLTRFGAYPIAVEIIDSAGRTLAAQTTFITFVPRQRAFRPTAVAWVWPLTERPHRTTDERFLDDDLPAELRADGRLGGLVDAVAGTRTPVTWAVDPALLDEADALTREAGYQVDPAGKARATIKPPSKDAADWLGRLKSAITDDPYFALPYADPDAVALTRAEQSARLDEAYRKTAVAEDVLGRAPAADIGWPIDGVADQRTLNRMVAAGSRTLLLNGRTLLPADQRFTPSATTTVPTVKGTRTALAYDATLGEVVSGGTGAPQNEALAGQRFLAETAMITNEQPSLSRTLVVAPDRHWNPSPEFARRLLTDTAQVPWLRDVPLQKIADAQPQPRTFTGYPPEHQQLELGTKYLDEVHKISARAENFSTIVTPPRNTFENGVLRMSSSAWRTRRTAAHAARGQLSDELSRAAGKVDLITVPRTLLAGQSGRVTFTVVNELAEQSVTVRLRVTSTNPGVLQVGDYAPDRLTIGPGQKATVLVPMQVRGNIDVPVKLELLTPQGRSFGEAHFVAVRPTGIGRTALLITGVALAVVFVGVGTRAIRARRRRTRAEESGDGRSEVGPVPVDDAARPPVG